MVSLRATSSSSSALLYPSSIIVAATALLPPREISLSSESPFVAVVVVVLSGSGPSSHDDRSYVVEVVDHPRRNLSAASAVIAPSPERKEPVNQNASLIFSPLHSLSLPRACIRGVPGSQNDTAAATEEIQSHYYLSGWQGSKQRTRSGGGGGGGGAISPPFVTGYTTEIKAGMEASSGPTKHIWDGNHPLHRAFSE